MLAAAFWLFFPPVSAWSDWQTEWNQTVAAARREGQVTIYAFPGGSMRPMEAGVFQKRFPEIKVVSVAGNPVPRILAERRAGKYLADIAVGGSTTPWDLYLAKALDPIKDALVLPEVSDESKWWQGKHHYIDPERRYALKFIGAADYGNSIHYNTNLANPNEFKSFWNFVSPKWKGKIEARDVRIPGVGSSNIRRFYHNPALGPNFIKRLFGEMDITFFRDTRQGTDWLATGKFAICFFCPSRDIDRARSQGLPIASFRGLMKEGASITSSSGNIGLVNRAPHPNAAKVYLNWLLSREGQLLVQKEYSAAEAGSSNSLRIDISKEMVPAEQRPLDGVTYLDVDTWDRMSMEQVVKVLNEALAESKK
jgi:iron(III) transport system substrate-binding protein